MRLRVLQLGSPMGLYGAERWILALVKHLDPERIESVVAAIKDDLSLEVPLCREAKKLGIRTHVFEAYGRVNFSAVRMLQSFIRENRIHVLHTHGYKQDVVGLMAIQGTGCKIISTPHGWSKHANFKVWCYEMLNRAVFPFFDAVAPLSEELYRSLKWVPGIRGKLHLIRNAVDISEIEAKTEVAEELQRWKQERAFVIGYIGQLIPRKGLDVLLSAATRLNGANWRLAIVGNGEQQPELESLAQQLGIGDRVRFFGYREDRLAFLYGFDVFVLPSRLEGIPRCLMEAMAAGVPVVASDISGCRNLIVHGQNGLLFPVDQPDDLFAAIATIVSDERLAENISRRGRDFIYSKFSAVRIAQAYETLFFSLKTELYGV